MRSEINEKQEKLLDTSHADHLRKWRLPKELWLPNTPKTTVALVDPKLSNHLDPDFVNLEASPNQSSQRSQSQIKSKVKAKSKRLTSNLNSEI